MNATDDAALNFLRKDEFNREDAHDILLKFLRDANPHATGVLATVFDIAITFFKPEKMEFKNINRDIRQDIILYWIDSDGDKDFTLEDFMKQIAELEDLEDGTSKDVKSSKEMASAFANKAKISLDEENLKIARGQTAEVGKKPVAENSEHVINEVEFKFEINDVIKEQKDENRLPWQQVDDSPPQRTFKWFYHDPVLGITKSGKEEVSPDTNFGTEKKLVIDKYMSERPGLIRDRQNNLIGNVKQLDKRYSAIIGEQDYTKSLSNNYKDFKDKMADTYTAKQDKEIQSLREQLKRGVVKENNYSPPC